MNKYGFLRETTKSAIQAGIDKTTGLPRTGLDEYLNIIFPEDIYSLTYKDRNTPAYLCPMGIQRMKEVFELYPEQYEVNKNQLLKEPMDLSGYDLI